MSQINDLVCDSCGNHKSQGPATEQWIKSYETDPKTGEHNFICLLDPKSNSSEMKDYCSVQCALDALEKFLLSNRHVTMEDELDIIIIEDESNG